MVLTVCAFLCSVKMRKEMKGPSIKDVRTFLAHFDVLLPPFVFSYLLLVDLPAPSVHAGTFRPSKPRVKYKETSTLFTYY